MSASTSSSYNTLLQLQGIYSARRLLLHSPSQQTPTATVAASATATPPPSYVQSETYSPGDNSFDSNVVMVLSVLLCALICSLGLNSIIRCALRCSSLVASDAGGTGQSTRLANTGVKRKALKTFPVMSYSAELKYPGLDAECIICLSEFVPGEKVRILPKCQHGFHVRCIDKWLSSHSSCPTCRHCLIETCQKIMGCSSSGGSSQVTQSEMVPVQPQQPVQVIMAPLEPEGPIRDYHGVS